MTGSQRKSRNDGDIDREQRRNEVKKISVVKETKRGGVNKIESVKKERGSKKEQKKWIRRQR